MSLIGTKRRISGDNVVNPAKRSLSEHSNSKSTADFTFCKCCTVCSGSTLKYMGIINKAELLFQSCESKLKIGQNLPTSLMKADNLTTNITLATFMD